MRKLAMAASLGMALALSACGGGDSSGPANDANVLGVDNMMLDMNGMDANAMDGMASMDGMDANGAVDANTLNAMANDAVTHDPDTNLANGI